MKCLIESVLKFLLKSLTILVFSRLISSSVASCLFFSGSSVWSFSYFFDFRPRKGAKIANAPGAIVARVLFFFLFSILHEKTKTILLFLIQITFFLSKNEKCPLPFCWAAIWCDCVATNKQLLFSSTLLLSVFGQHRLITNSFLCLP